MLHRVRALSEMRTSRAAASLDRSGRRSAGSDQAGRERGPQRGRQDHDRRALANGLPIATGVQDRMGCTGARWSLTGAEAILRLRALRASGDFDDYSQFHLAKEHERTHKSRYAGGEIPNPLPSARPTLRLAHSDRNCCRRARRKGAAPKGFETACRFSRLPAVRAEPTAAARKRASRPIGTAKEPARPSCLGSCQLEEERAAVMTAAAAARGSGRSPSSARRRSGYRPRSCPPGACP